MFLYWSSGLLTLLEPQVKTRSCESGTSLIDELFMVLKKLRLCIPIDDIANQKDLSPSTVSRIFHKWLNVMCRELSCLIAWPDKETLRLNMPKSFRKHYSRVTIVLKYSLKDLFLSGLELLLTATIKSTTQ